MGVRVLPIYKSVCVGGFLHPQPVVKCTASLDNIGTSLGFQCNVAEQNAPSVSHNAKSVLDNSASPGETVVVDSFFYCTVTVLKWLLNIS